jgi:hypothetical protein
VDHRKRKVMDSFRRPEYFPGWDRHGGKGPFKGSLGGNALQ